MKIIGFIISIGFLTSCLSLPETKLKDTAEVCISDEVKQKNRESLKSPLPKGWYFNCLSDGKKKEKIGPVEVAVPKGWRFNKAQWDHKRFVLEMSPECDFPFARHIVHFTYWKEKKDKSFVENIQNVKNKTNSVVSPFQIGKFKGKSIRYEEDGKAFSFSSGRRDKDALLIMLMAPKGNLIKMEQALKAMLH